MIVVLDTCILKFATFPRPDNPAALIVEPALRGWFETWASPAMLDEDAEFLAELLPKMQVCFPLTPLAVIRHEPDNRFIECALAVRAHYLITANTAPGHFDQRQYGPAKVFTPGAFVNAAAVQPLIARLASE